MCHKCRNKIRARAVTYYMNEEQIPDSERAMFERGAKFGELQASLFIEKAVAAIVAETTQILAVQEALTGQHTELNEISSLEAMVQLSEMMEQEGLLCLYGDVNLKDNTAKYNLLRDCHEMPAKVLIDATE